MAITFQKRQKEMKRLEKQRMKEERRAQKKLEKRANAQETNETATAVVETPEQGADRE
ncbi:MAG: hypothetical protein WBR26_21455 [Candidatus Acidiferrum sp.]